MRSPDDLTERQAYLVLNALPVLGPVTRNQLLASFGGDPRAVLAGPSLLAEPAVAKAVAGKRELRRGEFGPGAVRGAKFGGEILANWRRHFDLAREERRMAQAGVDFTTLGEPAYPKLLREIADPPLCLYRKGEGAFEQTCLAVIGSRRTTLYGLQVAKKLGAELARLGFCVVSGLARGIDTAAHEGALEGGGRTMAVLGTGIDTVFPPENHELSRRIAKSGAVLSEFPFGVPGSRFSFPMRNRIVAGMCPAVVVVESDVDGGAMITARLAGEQGRTVFAVPGRIDQSTSAGCHQLIRDGAALLTKVDDILSELDFLGGLQPAAIPEKPGRTCVRQAPVSLAPDERAVLARFDGGAILAPDALAAETGLSAAKLSAALMMLEIKHLVVKRLDGAYEETAS